MSIKVQGLASDNERTTFSGKMANVALNFTESAVAHSQLIAPIKIENYAVAEEESKMLLSSGR